MSKTKETWTKEENKNYTDLQEMYGQVLGQWNRYMGHVRASIGGIYENDKTYEQKGPVYTHVPKAKQQSATKWLVEHAFSDVSWLINKEVVTHQMMGYTEKIRGLQVAHLNDLLSFETLARLDNSSHSEANYYKSVEFCKDLRVGLWSELASGAKPEVFRRNLQKAYIERMKSLMTDQAPAPASPFGARETYPVAQSDVRSIVRGELKALQASLALAKVKVTDKEVRYHLDDCLERVSLILNPRK